MNSLIRCLQAEKIKHHKNWPLVVAVLGPLCQTGFLCLVLAYSENLVRRYRPGYEFWIELNFLAWNVLVMPVVAALIFELSWNMETEAKAWRHLLLAPVRRYIHFLAKCIGGGLLLFLSWGMLNVFILLGGFVLQHVLDAHIWGRFSGSLMVTFSIYSGLACLPLIGFHAWFSTRCRSMTLTLSATLIGAWVCGRYADMAALMLLLPWGAGSHMLAFFDRWNRSIPWGGLAWSALMAGVWILIGITDFSKRKTELL